MEKFNENEGVWRTIGGRRVFIRTGQSLSDAMRESGKFKTKSGKVKKENSSKEAKEENIDKEEYELFKKAMEKPDSIDPMTENSTDWEALEKKYKGRYEKENKKDFTKLVATDDTYKAVSDYENGAKDYEQTLKRFGGDKEKLDARFKEMGYTSPRKTEEGRKYRSSLTKLNDKSIEDGTYDLDTGKKVDFGNKGYNVSFEQSSDNYSDSEYFDKIEECRKLCDGKVYGGKFGGSPEISFYTEDKETAMKIMEKYNQHSIYDNSIGDVIENAKYNAETNKVNYKEPSKFDMRKYDVEVKHDKGKSTISVVASNEDSAKKMVMNSEKAPERAILGVKDKGSIINKTTSETMGDDYKEKLKQRQKEIDEWESKQQRNVNASYDSYDKDVRKSEDFIKEILTKNKKSTNETMNEAIRAKASKKTTAFKDDLPKKVEIKTQGTSNRKEVSENIQAHILDYYDSPDDFIRQMDVFDYMPTKWHAGKEIAKGGSYLVYNQDMSDFLDSLKINPKGKKFSDDKAFDMYTSLIGRESEKLYNRLQKNAYNKYMKEHPLSKMNFEDFLKMRKGD